MILIVSALKSEIQYLINCYSANQKVQIESGSLYISEDFHFLRTGVGYKLAVNSLKSYLAIHKPEMILNIGTAGALNTNFEIGSIVNVRSINCIEQSKIVNLPSFPGATSIIAGSVLTVREAIQSKTTKDELSKAFQADLVDMESYYFANIAQKEKIKFYSIKIVTDCADENTNTEFTNNYKQLTNALGKYASRALKIT